MRLFEHMTSARCAGVLLATLACASGGPPPEPAPTAVPDVQLEAASPGQALLYVFNASGSTLIKDNYEVKADGRRIADLPRNSYSVVAMAPGTHKLESAGRKLTVTLAEGQRGFVVVAYRPDKSWAGPLFGCSRDLTARALLSRVCAAIGPAPRDKRVSVVGRHCQLQFREVS